MNENVSSVRLKMFRARFTPQAQRRHSSFLNNLVYCEQPQCRSIHTISQQCNSFSTKQLKRTFDKDLHFTFFSAEAVSFIGFRRKTQFHPSSTTHLRRHSLYFLDFLARSVKCCESFAYVAPFDVSLYILKNY